MSYYVEETVFTRLGNYKRFALSPEARRDLTARMVAEVSKAVVISLMNAARANLGHNRFLYLFFDEQSHKEVRDMNYRLYLCGHHPLTRSQLLYSDPLRLVPKYSRVFSSYGYMFNRPNPNN